MLTNDPETCDVGESRAEADRLFRDAGWSTVIRPPWNGHFWTEGNLVGGIAPNGDCHAKAFTAFPQAAALALGLKEPEDYPDTYHEAAAVLIRQHTNGAPAEGPKYRFRRKVRAEVLPATPETQEAEMAQAQPINIQVNPVITVTGGHATSDAGADAEAKDEAYGEAGGATESHDVASLTEMGVGGSDAPSEQLATAPAETLVDVSGALEPDESGGEAAHAADDATESELADETPVPESPATGEPAAEIAGAVDSGDDASEADAAESVESADAGPAVGGLQVRDDDGSDEPSDLDLPSALDADFEEITETDLAEVEGADALAELEAPSLGDEIAEQQAQEQPQGEPARFYGLSDLDRRKNLLLLRVRRAAMLHRFETLGDWNEATLNAQQANLSRFVRGELGAGPQAQAHFDMVAEKIARIREIESVSTSKELAIDAATDATIDEINPDDGWPE